MRAVVRRCRAAGLALRRELVRSVRDAYQLPEGRACRAVGAGRSLQAWPTRPIAGTGPSSARLRERVREGATTRVSHRYQGLRVLLRREGWKVSRKLVHCVYRAEELVLPRRRTKRRSAAACTLRPAPLQVNERRATDLVHHTVAGGRTIRVRTMLDVHTRECVALVAQPAFRGADVARVPSDVEAVRGLPAVVSDDSGTGFTSEALGRRAYWNRVQLDVSPSGEQTGNAHIESFDARVRGECLSQHRFTSLSRGRGEAGHVA